MIVSLYVIVLTYNHMEVKDSYSQPKFFFLDKGFIVVITWNFNIWLIIIFGYIGPFYIMCRSRGLLINGDGE